MSKFKKIRKECKIQGTDPTLLGTQTLDERSGWNPNRRSKSSQQRPSVATTLALFLAHSSRVSLARDLA
jgi:hypothetical protein